MSSPYNLRSQCRGCRDTPDVPKRRNRRRNNSSNSNKSCSGHLEVSELFHHCSHHSLHEEVSMSSRNLGTIKTSDYYSSSSSSSLTSDKQEETLKGILINKWNLTKNNLLGGSPRNVSWGFATSTPLSLVDKEGYEDYIDLSEISESSSSEEEEEEGGGVGGIIDISSSKSASDKFNKMQKNNKEKQNRLVGGGGLGGTVTERRQVQKMSKFVQETSTSHQTHTTTTTQQARGRRRSGSVVNNGGGGGGFMDLQSNTSTITARSAFTTNGAMGGGGGGLGVGVTTRSGRGSRAGTPAENNMDETTSFSLFSTPGQTVIQNNTNKGVETTSGGGVIRRRGEEDWGDYHQNNGDSPPSSWRIMGVFSSFFKFLFFPLYWIIVQTLVAEKWVLEKSPEQPQTYRSLHEHRFRNGGGGGYPSSLWRSRSRTAGGGVDEREGYLFSEEEEEEEVAGRGGGGGESFAQSFLRRNGNGNDKLNLVDAAGGRGEGQYQTLGRIQNLGKKIVILWTSAFTSKGAEATTATGTAANLQFQQGNGRGTGRRIYPTVVEEDTDEGSAIYEEEEGVGTSWIAGGARWCKILGKILLLLLPFILLFLLGYWYWPYLIDLASGSWNYSKELPSTIQTAGMEFLGYLGAGMSTVTTTIGTMFQRPPSEEQTVNVPIPVLPLPTEEITPRPSYQPPSPVTPPANTITKEEYDALLLKLAKLEADLRSQSDEMQAKMKLQEEQLQKQSANKPPSIRDQIAAIKSQIIGDPTFLHSINSQIDSCCEKNKCPCPECPEPPPAQIINNNNVGLSEDQVNYLIAKALRTYDADKTGKPDLALEPAGGSVLSTRCTKSVQLKNSVVSLWGFPIWSPPNNPRTVIQPGLVPGECWSFEGSVGYVVIKLVGPAVINGFTMEHIPKSISPYGHIDSAPREFMVLGLHSETAVDTAHNFGTFTYEDNGETLQYFDVGNYTSTPYPIIELQILSNHGNLHHTCLYRFRVHGELALERHRPFTATVVSEPRTPQGRVNLEGENKLE